jgi:uncharacterized tellurite resistance protein B-like protein
MIARLKALVFGGEGADNVDKGRHATDTLHLAAAALLVEAACLDGHFDAGERDAIASLLQRQFHLEEAQTETLIDAARETVEESAQLYAFTRVIRDRFSDEERVNMIEMLWEVAYADGHLHEYESSLVRRVAGLIYVADRESGAARKRVRQRLEAADTPPS